MSEWKPKNRPEYVCPECHWEQSSFTRVPYCGPGDTNYVIYKCKRCGHEWEVED